jgi:uncharacterized protein
MGMKKLIYTTIVMVVVMCCKSNDPDPGVQFDRTNLVNNIADNIINPNFQSLNLVMTDMDAAVIEFSNNPNIVNLTDAQSKFKAAYFVWETCAVFNFGPSDQVALDKNINIFPTNKDKINANITSTYDLGQLTNLDAKGLPAIDYLLFGIAPSNQGVVELYTTDQNADGRKKYLVAVTADVRRLVNTVSNDWKPEGVNYVATFKTETGTDVGSAIGLIINGLASDLDELKNYKVAIPVGIVPGASNATGTPLPDKVEAYYSGISSTLLLKDLTTLQTVYTGGQGQGLDDYVVAMDAKYNDGSLNDAIIAQFSAAIAKVQAIPDPLSATINSNPAIVKSAYTELQKLLVLLKTDLPSALGVQITFVDNDGD